MRLEDLEQHVAQVILKRHDGNLRHAAWEMDVGTKMVEKLTTDIGNPSPDPMYDAEVIVDILREFFVQVSPTERHTLFEMVTDGYCMACGSDLQMCECCLPI